MEQTKRPYVRRTPGRAAEPAESDVDQVEAEIAAAELPVTADPDAPKAEQMVTASLADIERIVARQVHQRMGEQSAAASVRGVALPDQSTVDPYTIDRDVLTAQGYVVPIKKADQRDPDLLTKRA